MQDDKYKTLAGVTEVKVECERAGTKYTKEVTCKVVAVIK